MASYDEGDWAYNIDKEWVRDFIFRGINLPVPLQNYLATRLQQEYRDAYLQNIAYWDTELTGFQAFWDPETSDYPEISKKLRKEIQARTVDIGYRGESLVPAGKGMTRMSPAQYAQTKEAERILRRPNFTFGDIEEALHRAQYPAIAGMAAAKLGGTKPQHYGNLVTEAYLGIDRSLFTYERRGKKGYEASFAAHALGTVQARLKKARETEAEIGEWELDVDATEALSADSISADQFTFGSLYSPTGRPWAGNKIGPFKEEPTPGYTPVTITETDAMTLARIQASPNVYEWLANRQPQIRYLFKHLGVSWQNVQLSPDIIGYSSDPRDFGGRAGRIRSGYDIIDEEFAQSHYRNLTSELDWSPVPKEDFRNVDLSIDPRTGQRSYINLTLGSQQRQRQILGEYQPLRLTSEQMRPQMGAFVANLRLAEANQAPQGVVFQSPEIFGPMAAGPSTIKYEAKDMDTGAIRTVETLVSGSSPESAIFNTVGMTRRDIEERLVARMPTRFQRYYSGMSMQEKTMLWSPVNIQLHPGYRLMEEYGYPEGPERAGPVSQYTPGKPDLNFILRNIEIPKAGRILPGYTGEPGTPFQGRFYDPFDTSAGYYPYGGDAITTNYAMAIRAQIFEDLARKFSGGYTNVATAAMGRKLGVTGSTSGWMDLLTDEERKQDWLRLKWAQTQANRWRRNLGLVEYDYRLSGQVPALADIDPVKADEATATGFISQRDFISRLESLPPQPGGSSSTPRRQRPQIIPPEPGLGDFPEGSVSILPSDPMGEINVRNVKTFQGEGVYIGRPMPGRPGSPLGNPFHVQQYGREGAIQQYREWLPGAYESDPAVKAEIDRLHGMACSGQNIDLLCWCSPEGCHGDVIKEYIANMGGAPPPPEASGPRQQWQPTDDYRKHRLRQLAEAAQNRLWAEFPRFEQEFLGMGATKLEEFSAWKSSMDPQRLARFEKAFGALFAEKTAETLIPDPFNQTPMAERLVDPGTSLWSLWVAEIGGGIYSSYQPKTAEQKRLIAQSESGQIEAAYLRHAEELGIMPRRKFGPYSTSGPYSPMQIGMEIGEAGRLVGGSPTFDLSLVERLLSMRQRPGQQTQRSVTMPIGFDGRYMAIYPHDSPERQAQMRYDASRSPLNDTTPVSGTLSDATPEDIRAGRDALLSRIQAGGAGGGGNDEPPVDIAIPDPEDDIPDPRSIGNRPQASQGEGPPLWDDESDRIRAERQARAQELGQQANAQDQRQRVAPQRQISAEPMDVYERRSDRFTAAGVQGRLLTEGMTYLRQGGGTYIHNALQPGYTAVQSRGGISVYGESGQVLSAEEVNQVKQNVVSAYAKAITDIPNTDDPKAVMATVIRRFNDFLGKYYDDAIKAASQMPEIADKLAFAKQLGKDIGRSAIRGAGARVFGSEDIAGFEKGAWGAIPAWGDADALAARSEWDTVFGARVALQGTPEQVARGPQQVIFGAEGTMPMLTGRSQGGPPGGGRRSTGLWGSSLGQFLYSAYIGRRFWSWTMAPELQGAAEYQQMLSGYAQMAQLPSGVGGVAGQATRRSLMQEAMNRGRWEQWGGLTDIGYDVMTSTPAIPRTLSGLKFAAGAVAGGFIASQTVSMMTGIMGKVGVTAPGWLGAIGGPVAGVALGAGAIIAAGTIGMEAYNAIAKPDYPMTYGNLGNTIWNNMQYNIAAERLQVRQGIDPWTTPTKPLGTPWNVGGVQPDPAVMAQLTPEQRDRINFGGALPPSLQAVQDISSRYVLRTREEVQPIMPALTTLGRMLPGGLTQNEQLVLNFGESMARAGITTPEGVSMFASMAQQMGYAPGSYEFSAYLQRFSAAPTESQRVKMQEEAQRTARYTGSISGYFESPREASRLIRKYGLSTQPGVQGLQSLLSAAGMMGISGDSVMLGAPMQFGDDAWARRQDTVGDYLAQMAQRLGPIKSQWAAQFTNMLSAAGVGPGLALGAWEELGLQSQAQMQTAGAFISTAQQFGFGYGAEAYGLAAAGAGMSPWRANILTGLGTGLMSTGQFGGGTLIGLAEQTAGMSNTDLMMLSRLATGDMSAWSFRSYQSGNMTNRFLDQAGRPVYRSDWRGFIGMIGGQAWQGQNPFAQQVINQSANPAAFYGGDLMAATQSFFGGISNEDAQAWIEGGAIGRTYLHMQRQAGFQAASAGLAIQGINMRREYLWGGGTPTAPGQGSMWWYEDQMRQMQYQSQMANFAYSRQRMDVSNQYAMRAEALGQAQMANQVQWQRFSMDFSRQGSMLQREWTREDWEFQDQTRSLQRGWALEDINEAIRFSSGRQRRQLVRQRERMVVSQNLEDEQTQTQRGRQEQIWARQDEFYKKQIEYIEESIRLNEEQFNMQVERREEFYKIDSENLDRQMEEYQAQYDLQDEIINKQREFQAEQLDLQEKQAGIQAAAAAETADYADQMFKVENSYEGIAGWWEEMQKNDPTSQFQAFSEMGINLSKVNIAVVENLNDTMVSLSGINPAAVGSLAIMFKAMAGIDPGVINALRSLIADLYD